jgi:hypothetical protein
MTPFSWSAMHLGLQAVWYHLLWRQSDPPPTPPGWIENEKYTCPVVGPDEEASAINSETFRNRPRTITVADRSWWCDDGSGMDGYRFPAFEISFLELITFLWRAVWHCLSYIATSEGWPGASDAQWRAVKASVSRLTLQLRFMFMNY